MKKQEVDRLPKCFLITPIGSRDSLDRIRVDQWMKLIYYPALKGKYQLIRADKISVPGTITKQIIDHIIDAELVIIDFTPGQHQDFSNPNVMYEAAIRHIAQKPLIQIAPLNCPMPFDIKDFRYLSYDPNDLAYPQKLRKEIKKALTVINSSEYKTPDIIGHTFDLNRIVADPEKFIEIIKEKLNLGGYRLEDRNESGYINISTPSGAPYLSWSGTVPTPGMNFIGGYAGANCPSCGNTATLIPSLTLSGYATFGLQKQYKCSYCGTVFFK